MHVAMKALIISGVAFAAFAVSSVLCGTARPVAVSAVQEREQAGKPAVPPVERSAVPWRE